MFHRASFLLFASSSYLGLPLKENFQRDSHRKFQFLSSPSLFSSFPVSGQRDKYSARSQVAEAKGRSKGHPDILSHDLGTPRARLGEDAYQPSWKEYLTAWVICSPFSESSQKTHRVICECILDLSTYVTVQSFFFSSPLYGSFVQLHVLICRKMQRWVFNH